MNINDLCISYLNALNEGDLDNVLKLFTEDAFVVSPARASVSLVHTKKLKNIEIGTSVTLAPAKKDKLNSF